MTFANPPGDCHIKSGMCLDDDIFVVKIATGFYQNSSLGLPVVDGAILIFSRNTGRLETILCDGGYLTLVRTALAACVCAQLTPWQ